MKEHCNDYCCTHFTPTPEKDTAMNNLPRVVKFADIRVGQKIERTYTYTDGAEQIRRGVVALKSGGAVESEERCCLAWATDDRDERVTLRVLEEPPAPALPTAPGTVIDCTLDGRDTASLILVENGKWLGVDQHGTERTVYPNGIQHRITDWTVRPKPGAES